MTHGTNEITDEKKLEELENTKKYPLPNGEDILRKITI